MKWYTVFAVGINLVMNAACNSETESEICLKPLMTSPPSYSENIICPSELNFYTFICDAISQYISWNFNNEIEKSYYGNRNYLEIEGEDRDHTRYYDYHVALPLLQSRIDGNFSMRSTFTIHAHNLTQFPVNCSTHCGQEMKNRSAVYRVAELPKVPRRIHFDDPSKNRNNNCTGPKTVVKWDPPENSESETYRLAEIPKKPRNLQYHWRGEDNYYYNMCGIEAPRSRPRSRVYFEWEPPENLDRTVHSHYEKIWNRSGVIIHRLHGLRTISYARDHSKAQQFEVYAVDKCERQGEHAQITVPPEED